MFSSIEERPWPAHRLPNQIRRKTGFRALFAYRPAPGLPAPATGRERKFNPYHDPRNGRFTFAPGGPNSLQNPLFSDPRGLWKPREKPNRASRAERAPDTRGPAQREGLSTRSSVGTPANVAAQTGGLELPLREVQTADLAIYLPITHRANGLLLKTAKVDPPIPQHGGALLEHFAVKTPDQEDFYSIYFHGDVEGWRQQIELGAKQLGLKMAKVHEDEFVLADGPAYLLSDCAVTLDGSPFPLPGQ